MRTLQFHRDFKRYSGGHGKVWDYFNHAATHPRWRSRMYLAPGSVAQDNPWLASGQPLDAHWPPLGPDPLFLGGMDWQEVPDNDPSRPVINLIQHVRHADPSQDVHPFLARRAVRICVSAQVADAIQATGLVHGPVRTIEAALHLPQRAVPAQARHGIFIGALKQPRLGRELADALRAIGHAPTLVDTWQPRDRYLDALSCASIAVLLPRASEGFYLPALEAMALGCAVVVPDSIGNRAYLAPGDNALVPPMQLDALVQAVAQLQQPELQQRLRQAGARTAARFDLQRERAAFHRILDQLDALWLDT